MRVAVVGGGVVGLAPAWYLKKMGAEPFVVEAGVAGVQDLIEGADMSRSTGAVRRDRMWSCRSFRGSRGSRAMAVWSVPVGTGPASGPWLSFQT